MALTELFRRRGQRAVPIWLVVLALLLVVARIAYHVSERPLQGSDLIQWVPLERAGATAVALGLPIMIDFTADWCQPCHELDEQVFRDASLSVEINERFVPVRIVDRQQEDGSNTPEVDAVQKRYAVKGFPTVVFVHPNGAQIARMEGFRGRQEFMRIMERAR